MTDVRRVTGAEVVPCPGEVTSIASSTVWLGGGDLAVLPCGDGEPPRVEVHEVSGPSLSVTWSDGTLRVEHREPGEQVWAALRRAVTAMALPSARLVLVVPPAARLTVRTATAAVYVEGLTDVVSVTTVAGAVTVRATSGTADVTTGAGAVTAARASGTLRVKTATGAVSVAGDRLRAARLATVSGRVDVALADSNCLVTSNTAAGALELRVPPGTGYDLTAHAPHGSVRIDDETVVEAAVDTESGGSGDPIHRGEGDRSLVVKARTLSGTISLRRDLAL